MTHAGYAYHRARRIWHESKDTVWWNLSRLPTAELLALLDAQRDAHANAIAWASRD